MLKNIYHLCFLVIKTKCVHQWLYIKGRDMFVCILFCGFNGTNGTEALVCAQAAVTDNSSNEHSAWFQKQHISELDRLLLNKQTKLILCYSTRDVSFVTGMSVPRNVLKKKLFNDVGVAFTGEYLICPLTRQVQNARIRFISDLFPHMNEAWNRSENIGIHVIFFPAYTVVGHIRSVPHGRKKSELGHMNHAV